VTNVTGEHVRVIINAECTLNTRAGIGHHTSELIRCLQERMGDDIGAYPSGIVAPILRFWGRHVERYLAARERPGVFARVEALTRRAYLATLRRTGSLFAPDPFNYSARGGRYELYHEPNFLAHPCPLPTVVTVHDLSVLLHPQWHPRARIADYNRGFERALKQACHVLAVSEFTKQEVVQHLGWPAEKITVSYNGRRPFLRPLSANECVPVLQKLDLKPGYLLHVGTIEPRKNIGMLLNAHTAIPTTLRQRHPLVLVGGRGWQANELEETIAALSRDGSVRRLGYCPDETLAALYSSAQALVFPTLYEGFGMPTIEMMACGGAVLASTAGAVAETVGNAAHLIDPHDEAGWRDAMIRVCTDDDWRNSLRANAEAVAQPFTWDACAQQTLTAYRKALGKETQAPARRAA
jgi:glycosyltransferase involved in cell wall biosynthesis